MAKKRILLGERELELMKALWKLGRGTVYDVQKAIRGKRAYTTVQTMLNSLERKGLIRHDTEDRTFIYYPKVERSKALQDHLEDLVERVFDGSVVGVLMSLGKAEGMSDEEVEKLRQLIDKEDDE